MMPEGVPADLGAARVLVNALALRPAANGARSILSELLRRLPDAWPEADISVLVAPDVELEDAARLTVVRVEGGSGLRRAAQELRSLPRFARRLRADVVINPHETVPSRLEVPVVVIAQNLLYHCDGGVPPRSVPARARAAGLLRRVYYRRQMPRAYRRANRVVAVSEHAARVLNARAGLPLDKVDVVPLGADRLPLRDHAADGGVRRLVTVGAVAYYKRLDVLVEALRMLGDGYELVVAGELWPGGREAIEGARVRVVGEVSDDALAELYSGAFASVSLSRCESFGLPVAEAMHAGAPVVVADEPWSKELCGDAASFADGDDPAAVAAAIRALEAPEAWRERSAAAAARAEPLTWQAAAEGVARSASRATRSAARPRS